MNLYLRIIKYYRPFVGRILLGLLLLFASIGLNLLKPWPVKFLIDDILGQNTQNCRLPFWPENLSFPLALAILAGSLIAIHFLWGLCNLWKGQWMIDIGLRALFRVRSEIYAYLQYLPLTYHDHTRSGNITYRVVYDSHSIQTFFNQGFTTVIGSIVTLIGTFIVMFNISPKLTLVSLLVIPGLLGVIYFFAKRIRKFTSDYHQQESDLLATASEGLTNIRMVQAFGQEKREISQFSDQCHQSVTANKTLQFVNISSVLATGVVTAMGTALLIYYGGLEVIAGHVKIGDLFVFFSYLAMLYQPLESLSYTAWAMEGAAAGASRVFSILDTPNDVPEKKDAATFRPKSGHIRFQNVSFAYEKSNPVLQNLSLSIEPGQKVAIVGGTGAGKTTLLSLIPRFYDATDGSILIDDQNLKDLTKSSLRTHMGLVLQETLLLSGTIRQNIAYGMPDASFEEIQEAAREAQAEEFILNLPNGYDTEVGERGVRLSGGQRQRIGIARAVLKKSTILLMDEPTSALDLATEAELMSAIDQLSTNPTIVIVTHRLNTIHHVDRIFVMEHGTIIESGTGDELIKKKGLYWKLWNASGLKEIPPESESPHRTTS